MSTTNSELIDFAEALGWFLEPSDAVVVRKTERFVLAAEPGGTWAAVEGIRLRDGDAPDAIETVRQFLAETGTTVASWWLTERSTPHDVEEQLLAAGLTREDDDYLHTALVMTTAPPPGPSEIDVRTITTADEYIAVRRLNQEVFEIVQEEHLTDDDLVASFERGGRTSYGAWLDGELVAAADAVFTRAGGYLTGGATRAEARGRGAYRALVRARWDDAVARGTPALAVGAGPMSRPILERLGFEQVLQFRRLQCVAPG